MAHHDPYSRLDYRRMVAWPRRREREWPLLREILATAPARRVLDLGCGTGEHSRLFAEQGFEVVGVDRSETMIAKAREAGEPEGVRFVQGDLREVEDLAGLGRSGAAVCLGNTLPHLTEQQDLERLAAGLGRSLLPGAPLLLQILNYDRIFERGERHLPLNFRPAPEGEDGELVFLRLMTPRPDGTVIFNPSTLRYRPDADPPLTVDHARRVVLRGWRRSEIEAVLGRAGFEGFEAWGSFEKDPFEPRESRDLLLCTRLAAG